MQFENRAERFFYKGIPGWFDFAEVYDRAIKELTDKPSTMVEVGALFGASTAYLVDHAKPEQEIVVIDKWESPKASTDPDFKPLVDKHGNHFQAYCACMGKARLDRVQSWRGDSLRLLETFSDASVDFVFLDGCHEFLHVKAELEICQRIVKPGGIIAGHDVYHAGVKQALHGYHPEQIGASWWMYKV